MAESDKRFMTISSDETNGNTALCVAALGTLALSLLTIPSLEQKGLLAGLALGYVASALAGITILFRISVGTCPGLHW